jgi:hypothetical protein
VEAQAVFVAIRSGQTRAKKSRRLPPNPGIINPALALAWKLLIIEIMNTGHLPVSESAARRAPKSRARKGRGRPKNGADQGQPRLAAHGSLTRTKALLLAALRVWELKHRVGE